MTKEEILSLMDTYGFQNILRDHNLTLWKVLEILDELGYIFLENYKDNS